MSITFELSNFPQINQNHEPSNPYPDVNAGMDCVPSSIAAALTWFTGVQYYGDEIIDAVYGSSYTGGTAASAYEAYCAQHGVKLSPVDGAPAGLVAALHQLVHEGKPCLITIPGQWNNPATSGANPGAVTHVCVVYGDGAGMIRMMNPWIAPQPHDVSDSWLETKLCYGQIWPLERLPMFPPGWTDQNNVLTAPNGITVVNAFRMEIYNTPWDADNWPLEEVQHVDNLELSNPSLGSGQRQTFVRTILEWTDAQTPPFKGVVIHQWAGQEEMALRKALAAAQVAPTPTPVPNWQAEIGVIAAGVKAIMDKEGISAPVSGGAEPDPALIAAQQRAADLEAQIAKLQAKLDRAYNAAHAIYTLIEQEFVIQAEEEPAAGPVTAPTVAVPAVAMPQPETPAVPAESAPEQPAEAPAVESQPVADAQPAEQPPSEQAA